jgi:hypothetical protein
MKADSGIIQPQGLPVVSPIMTTKAKPSKLLQGSLLRQV